MARIFADASSIILLEKSGLFDLCLSWYDFVLTRSVYNEITGFDYPDTDRFKNAFARKRFTVCENYKPHDNKTVPVPDEPGLKKLDKGERDTIYLSLNQKKGFILTDDGSAARYCYKNKLAFINALLIPKIFWFAGILSKKTYLEKTQTLKNQGRYSFYIKKWAQNAQMKHLKRFLPDEPMKDNKADDFSAWKKRGTAFVIRCHRHLWGKNNEDPLAFLFQKGLKNDFAKQMVLGWNKFSHDRPYENWGLDPKSNPSKKLRLPAGIVIPDIIDKKLNSIFFYPLDRQGRQMVLQGSHAASMILGEQTDLIFLIHDLMDGLYLRQETPGKGRVMIHPDPALSIDESDLSALCQAKTLIVLNKREQKPWPAIALETHGINISKTLSYQSHTDLNDLLLFV